MERIFLTTMACILAVSAGWAAEQRAATVLWRGVPSFPEGKVSNALACDPRGLQRIGDIGMPAIFLHPKNADLALLRYPPVAVSVKEGQRAFLLASFGISTGFDWNEPGREADGVRFHLMDGDRELLSYHLQASKWVPAGLALPVAEGRVSLTPVLATDPGPRGDSSYDWAVIGDPMLLALDDRVLPPDAPVSGSAGIVVADLGEGTGKIVVEGLNAAGEPLAGATAAAERVVGLPFVRFDFTALPECVAWRWRLDGSGEATAWGGSWAPSLKVMAAGLSRAVSFQGQPRRVRVTVRNTGMGVILPEHGAWAALGGRRQELGRLGPAEAKTVSFDVGPGSAGAEGLTVSAGWQGGSDRHRITVQDTVWPPLPRLPDTRPTGCRADQIGDYMLVENPQVRWVIYRDAPGLGALVYAWTDGGWELTGSVTPWVELVLPERGEVRPRLASYRAGVGGAGVRLQATLVDEEGVTCRVRGALAPDDMALRLDLTVSAPRDTPVLAVRGPALHIGEGGTGAGKGVAMFPGLEYLEGEELSSSTRDIAMPHADRRVPHKFKVTVPMMLVETRPGGPVMVLAWDAKQKWDGVNVAPAACFASPDFITNKDSHLLQLLLPSTPEPLPENARQAREPVTLAAGKPWRLSQYIVAGTPQPDASAAFEWFDKLVGYPEAEAPPRSFEEEMALCRHGFLVTCWDDQTQKGRHVVGWGPANSPGHATLMLMDGRAVATGEAKSDVLARADLVGNQTIRQEGAKGLASNANCHIMGWEFPYHWGSLPGALEGMKASAEGTMKGQEANGGWGYYPSEANKVLGAPGTQTMGTCGQAAYYLAKWAAISGDPAVTAALRKALDRLRQFAVPRGAQGWECPILEPDVLASAYALRAAVWAYMATGEEQYLTDARFYARTGLAFQYVWDDGAHPGMRYASIPVFGSTFFTHSWIGLPVQWCGLVHAYGLVELMRFDNNDLWRKQVEGMTVSAMHQQWPLDNAELAGSYPDSYGQWFTVRNGVFINPENIQLNLMALRGLDPGLRSVAAKVGDRLAHVTAPGDLKVAPEGAGLRISLKYVAGETCYLTVAGLAPPTSCTANGQPLPKQPDLPHGSTGWTTQGDLGITVIGGKCDGEGRLEVVVGG